MHFSVLSKVEWATASAASAVLFFVMLRRRRWHQFPALMIWMAFLTARAVALAAAYSRNSRFWYGHIYWAGFWIDFALQLWVVAEIARIVLRPTGTWVRDARGRFIAGGLAGALVAGLFAWAVSPPAHTAWLTRGNLFTSLVICELFVVMSLTANRLGLGWRSHVMAVGQGLTAWSSLMVLKTALQSIPGSQHFYLPLEDIRGFTYSAATCWMAVRLWMPEPERQPISEDLQQYILALHRRVEYDLRRLDAGS
ncbi:MAG TPA: hypothetical protein VHZ09_11360 [Acidobacteriaceae bacterium]|nr:hypothetical protein [Acidobacteriaceae bacterium]